MEVAGYGAVVVGVDGSEAGEAALQWGVGLAAAEHRPVRVVHACGVHRAGGRTADADRDFAGQLLVQRAVVAAHRIDPGVRVQGEARPGSPTRVLAEASETAGLVVVGDRGAGSLTRTLLGTVGSQLAREAWSPVVVVRDERGHPGWPVVVGVDCSPGSEAAVEFAFRMASLWRVPLTVLHATWDLRDRAAAVLETRGYTAQVDRVEDEAPRVEALVAGAAARYPDVPVTLAQRCGEPAHELVEASRHTSLLVVGCARGRGPAGRRHGSVSRRVAERAASPVAVVHP